MGRQHWAELLVLQGHEFSVNSAVWSPDGQRILTASVDDTAHVWQAFPSTDSLMRHIETCCLVRGIIYAEQTQFGLDFITPPIQVSSSSVPETWFPTTTLDLSRRVEDFLLAIDYDSGPLSTFQRVVDEDNMVKQVSVLTLRLRQEDASERLALFTQNIANSSDVPEILALHPQNQAVYYDGEPFNEYIAVLRRDEYVVLMWYWLRDGEEPTFDAIALAQQLDQQLEDWVQENGR